MQSGWGSLLSMMSRRKDGERLYCSVVATYDETGSDGWLYGKDLEDYLTAKGKQVEDKGWNIKAFTPNGVIREVK